MVRAKKPEDEVAIELDSDQSMPDSVDSFTLPTHPNTAASDDEPKEEVRPSTKEESRIIRRGA